MKRPLHLADRCVRTLFWRLGFVAFALVAHLASAQGISFTVQVIAVSDQANAIEISRTLVRDGYPAYVVRSTGAEGDVYRVRVGAFGNRAAAARYAAAMPPIGGAEPVPMVAEAIPSGIMPLAPRVLWQGGWGDGELAILPWPAGLALRQQPGSGATQASYTLIQGAEVRTLRAWWVMPLAALPASPAPSEVESGFGDIPFIDLRPAPAQGAEVAEREDAPGTDGAPETDGAPGTDGAPETDGASEASAGGGPLLSPPAPAVASERGPAPLWADLQSDTPEVGLAILRDRLLWPAEEGNRETFQSATLAFVAGRLGVDPELVQAQVRPAEGDEAPRLVLLEVSDRSGRDTGDVRAIALAEGAAGPFGPELVPGSDLRWWPELPQLEWIEPAAASGASFGGAGWSVSADFGFARITTADGASWRAVAGAPIWSDGRYLLVLDGTDLLLVDFAPR